MHRSDDCGSLFPTQLLMRSSCRFARASALRDATVAGSWMPWSLSSSSTMRSRIFSQSCSVARWQPVRANAAATTTVSMGTRTGQDGAWFTIDSAGGPSPPPTFAATSDDPQGNSTQGGKYPGSLTGRSSMGRQVARQLATCDKRREREHGMAGLRRCWECNRSLFEFLCCGVACRQFSPPRVSGDLAGRREKRRFLDACAGLANVEA